jgi:hypothetical protein
VLAYGRRSARPPLTSLGLAPNRSTSSGTHGSRERAPTSVGAFLVWRAPACAFGGSRGPLAPSAARGGRLLLRRSRGPLAPSALAGAACSFGARGARLRLRRLAGAACAFAGARGAFGGSGSSRGRARCRAGHGSSSRCLPKGDDGRRRSSRSRRSLRRLVALCRRGRRGRLRRRSRSRTTPLVPFEVANDEDVARAIREYYTKYEYRIPMRDGVKLHTHVYVPKDDAHVFPMMLQRTPYGVPPYGVDNGPVASNSRVLRPVRAPPGHDPRGVRVRAPGRARQDDERGHVRRREATPRRRRQRPERRGRDHRRVRTPSISSSRTCLETAATWACGASRTPASTRRRRRSPATPRSRPSRLRPPSPSGSSATTSTTTAPSSSPKRSTFTRASARCAPSPCRRPRGASTTAREISTTSSCASARSRARTRSTSRASSPSGTISSPTAPATTSGRHATLGPTTCAAKPAVLTVGGFFDAEDLWGSLETYKAFETQSPGAKNHLVMGPWRHGGWARSDGDKLGALSFAQKNLRAVPRTRRGPVLS